MQAQGCPHLLQDWAHPAHICTASGLTPATSAPDWAYPCRVCTGTTLSVRFDREAMGGQGGTVGTTRSDRGSIHRGKGRSACFHACEWVLCAACVRGGFRMGIRSGSATSVTLAPATSTSTPAMPSTVRVRVTVCESVRACVRAVLSARAGWAGGRAGTGPPSAGSWNVSAIVGPLCAIVNCGGQGCSHAQPHSRSAFQAP